MKKIITIGRQCGSGGHTIGKLVAERLGWDFYDKEIIKAVSLKSGLTEETVEKEGEYSTTSLLYNIATRGFSSYNVFIFGNLADRTQRAINEHGIEAKDAEKHILPSVWRQGMLFKTEGA